MKVDTLCFAAMSIVQAMLGKPRRRDGLVEVYEISHTSYYRNHINKLNVYPTVGRYLASIADDDDAEIGSDF